MAEYFLNLLIASSIYLSWPVVYFVRVVKRENKSPSQIQGLYVSAFVIAGFLIPAVAMTALMASKGPYNSTAFMETILGLGLFGLVIGVVVGNLVGYFMRTYHLKESNHPDFAEDQDGNPIVPPTTNSLTDL